MFQFLLSEIVSDRIFGQIVDVAQEFVSGRIFEQIVDAPVLQEQEPVWNSMVEQIVGVPVSWFKGTVEEDGPSARANVRAPSAVRYKSKMVKSCHSQCNAWRSRRVEVVVLQSQEEIVEVVQFVLQELANSHERANRGRLSSPDSGENIFE